jgi:beta-lactamase class A
MRILCLYVAILTVLPGSASAQRLSALTDTVQSITRRVNDTIAVAAVDLATGDRLSINSDLRFHAASTMKIPVLIELARRVDAGALRWNDSLIVRNQFASIVDSSLFALNPEDDSDSSVYLQIGQKAPVRYLAERMIERSSNLATNLLIATLGAPQVNQTAHRLGADSIAVLRGVEDQKAYDQGLSNTTTARDLAQLLLAIEEGRAASPASTKEMLRILSAQEFNDGIPAGLPPGTRVAHKTGEITRIAHDAAIIYPRGHKPIVLVVLTRGFDDRTEAMAIIRQIARVIYDGVAGH